MVVLNGGATITELRVLCMQGGESRRVSESHSWILGSHSDKDGTYNDNGMTVYKGIVSNE